MTDSLLSVRYAELRNLVETKTGTVELPVERPALRALLDVAEAAHRANFESPCEYCRGTDTECPNVRLRDALARIDFWRHA